MPSENVINIDANQYLNLWHIPKFFSKFEVT